MGTVPDFIIGTFVITGGIFWIAAFAYGVGVIADKLGLYD
jgi:hypothetical protein